MDDELPALVWPWARARTDFISSGFPSRNTIQNWETGATPLPSTIEGACTVWEGRLKKEMPDIGPLTLIYADGPMSIDPYRPRRMATLKREAFPTNAAALARVQRLWGRDDFDGPFIIEKSGAVELMRVVDGSDKGAPTQANTIRKVAAYVRANSHLRARDRRLRCVAGVRWMSLKGFSAAPPASWKAAARYGTRSVMSTVRAESLFGPPPVMRSLP